MSTAGRFITMEGIEGVGKSTQVARLSAALTARFVAGRPFLPEATAPWAATLTSDIEAAVETNGRRTGLLDPPDPELDYELPTQRAESPIVQSPDGHDAQGPGRIIRRKRHSATPMSIDDALYEMELVGHDFYLFADATSGLPSVVYRRHGFDYGVIQLV